MKTAGPTPLIEYVERTLGKVVDYDGVYGSQCVDIVVDYWDVVYKVPKNYSIGSAKNFVKWFSEIATLRDNFDLIKDTDDFQPGDVIIWDEWGNNPYGHCAIYLHRTDDNKLKVLEQDGMIDKDKDGRADGDAYYRIWQVSDKILGALRHKSHSEPVPAPKKTGPVKIPVRVREPVPTPPDPAPVPSEPAYPDYKAAIHQTGQVIAKKGTDWLKSKKSKNKDEGKRVAKKFGWSTVINTKIHLFALNLKDAHSWLAEYDWLLAMTISGGLFGIYWGIGKLSTMNYLNVVQAVQEDRRPGWLSVKCQWLLGTRAGAVASAKKSNDWRFYNLVYGEDL